MKRYAALVAAALITLGAVKESYAQEQQEQEEVRSGNGPICNTEEQIAAIAVATDRTAAEKEINSGGKVCGTYHVAYILRGEKGEVFHGDGYLYTIVEISIVGFYYGNIFYLVPRFTQYTVFRKKGVSM